MVKSGESGLCCGVGDSLIGKAPDPRAFLPRLPNRRLLRFHDGRSQLPQPQKPKGATVSATRSTAASSIAVGPLRLVLLAHRKRSTLPRTLPGRPLFS